MPIIRENQFHRKKRGLVSSKTKRSAKKEKFGGAAITSGARGRIEGSGLYIAYHPDPDKLTGFIHAVKLQFQVFKMGEEEVRIG